MRIRVASHVTETVFLVRAMLHLIIRVLVIFFSRICIQERGKTLKKRFAARQGWSVEPLRSVEAFSMLAFAYLFCMRNRSPFVDTNPLPSTLSPFLTPSKRATFPSQISIPEVMCPEIYFDLKQPS